MHHAHDPFAPIAVLDSGLGGLTVARAIRHALPLERIVYFGDTARLPYGSKSAETVNVFVQQIIGFLQPLRPKHVVIACNTATALALPAVRAAFPELSISGVIEPGARAAAVAAGDKLKSVIGVIATEATVHSRAYEKAIRRRRLHTAVVSRSTPLLVPIIEEGRGADDPLVRLALKQYLLPMLARGLDVLVLGCTHYPILKELIIETVGTDIPVIDSAEQCAADVAGKLQAARLRRLSLENAEPSGDFNAFVTDDPARFQRLGSRLLGIDLDLPTLISTDRLTRIAHAQQERMSWQTGQLKAV